MHGRDRKMRRPAIAQGADDDGDDDFEAVEKVKTAYGQNINMIERSPTSEVMQSTFEASPGASEASPGANSSAYHGDEDSDLF